MNAKDVKEKYGLVALRGADLSGAYLSGAYLTGADLTGAYLRGADLRGTNLTGANLTGANFLGAYLSGAYLRGANLRGANLTGANLSGANLTGADLRGADLTGALGIFQIGPIGSRGDFLYVHFSQKGLRFKAGCKYLSEDELLAEIQNKHGNNSHAQAYRAAIACGVAMAKAYGWLEVVE